MPTLIFDNSHDEPLRFVVDPSGTEYEIPPHGKLGIRHELAKDPPQFVDVGKYGIRFWCEEPYEIDIVHPSAFDLLLYEICLRMGFCGGLVDDKPTHVSDLLPEGDYILCKHGKRC